MSDYAIEQARSDAVSPPSQVDNWQHNLEESLKSLTEAIFALRTRLEKVVVDQDSPNPDEDSVAELMLVPLADWLRSQVRVVEANQRRLTNLMQRIEL